jgi:hypothetical protein
MRRYRFRSAIIILVLIGLLTGCNSLKLNPYNLTTRIAPLPFNSPISFDEVTYDSQLHRVIIPAGESGQVALIDPANMHVQLISGFSRQLDIANPMIGSSSVALAGGFLYGLDQETMSIKTIRLSTGSLIASTHLQAAPDTIRFISATHELWVTEKGLHRIEIFNVSGDDSPVPVSKGAISIPNGPEALIIDDQRGLAFTNRPNQSLTDVIQVMTHTVIAHWGSGCSSAKGMAVDEKDGYLFVACEEGKLVIMDINNDGYQITSQNYGGELDYVAYNPHLHHIYLPSGVSGVIAIFQLQKLLVTPEPIHAPGKTPAVNPAVASVATPPPDIKPSLLLLGTADTDIHAKCVTTDENDNIWVCDPNNGRILIIHDEFPDSGALPQKEDR